MKATEMDDNERRALVRTAVLRAILDTGALGALENLDQAEFDAVREEMVDFIFPLTFAGWRTPGLMHANQPIGRKKKSSLPTRRL